ncbi:MAG: peptidoglycan synthetase [Chitinophagales bacterium]|nr:MAG: peptidoglycan synthetase [Chitinophagales bacterium]
MNIHFIAIGGSVMHNLALCLRSKGYNVSGSDDEIFEPAVSALRKSGLLPEKTGWFPEKIDRHLDAVILGMHAKPDNPELLKALQLGIPVYSFPAYVYEQIKDKTRIVIAGSHGKTTITSMILHVMKKRHLDFDYLVGSRIPGFEHMVKLSHKAPIAVLEGDEYLSSAMDTSPKFLHYRPHIALVSGIAWDHVNVFPTFETYTNQFRHFIESIEPHGTLIFNNEDPHVRQLAINARPDIRKIPYRTPAFEICNHQLYVQVRDRKVPLKIIGKHNLQNLEGARLVCEQLGIRQTDYLHAIADFTGASKRLEVIYQNAQTIFFRDFAHSPSKLRATLQAVKEQYPERRLIACMELHTYSSLNPAFITQYAATMDPADIAVVYYNHHTLELKKIQGITPELIQTAFSKPGLQVFTQKSDLLHFLKSLSWEHTNLLMMSSGNFDGLDVTELIPEKIK